MPGVSRGQKVLDPLGLELQMWAAMWVLRVKSTARKGRKKTHILNYIILYGVLAHAFKPSTWEVEKLCEFEANLVYTASSRPARAT